MNFNITIDVSDANGSPIVVTGLTETPQRFTVDTATSLATQLNTAARAAKRLTKQVRGPRKNKAGAGRPVGSGKGRPATPAVAE